MRPAITALALAGLTTAAIAQNVGTVTVTASTSTVNVGDTFTIGVVLSDNIPCDSVFAFDLLVSGSGAAFSTVAGSLLVDPLGTGAVGMWDGAFAGQVNPDGASGAGIVSDILGPIIDPALDDVTVFSFQVLTIQGGSITFDASDGGVFEGGSNLQVDGISTYLYGIVAFPWAYDEVIFESVSVSVIPPPPCAFAIALACSLATRRRR